jgi:hypothetical protein
MAAVMIGVDPHKASHTAVAISAAEEPLGELRVRACAGQAGRLLAWAAAWPQRTWAVEGAGGLGHLPAASSCRRPVSGCWMCRPSSARGSGCWPPVTRIRTIPTMPGRWPSRRCGRPVSGRSGPMITQRC